MRATIVLAGCFLISASSFAAEQQPAAKLKPVVVALATTPTAHQSAARKAAASQVTRGAAIETPVAEGSLEKFGATGLAQ